MHHVCMAYSLPRQAHASTPLRKPLDLPPPFILNSETTNVAKEDEGAVKQT